MRGFLISLLFIAAFIGYNSIFIVSEGSRGLVLQLNELVRDSENRPIVYQPGLHFKTPFIQDVKILDARIQTMITEEQRFITGESKHLIVDSYLKWRISNFEDFYRVTGGDKIRAENILRPILIDRLRSEFGRLDVKEIVRDSRSRFTAVKDILNGEAQDNLTALSDNTEAVKDESADATGNENTSTTTTSTVNNTLASAGIEVVDIRIKKINLPEEVSEAIFNNMRAERRIVATEHRSLGEESALRIRSQADREASVIKSTANREAQILIGEADAQAAKMFADAFSQDTDFYSFLRSLRAYENTFQENQNIMVLSPDTDFFRYMKQPTVNEAQ